MHTHSPHAVGWAQAGRDIPCYGTTHADYFHGPVPCARSLTPEEVNAGYEHNTGVVIVETFQTRNINPVHVPGVICRNHGPFAFTGNKFEFRMPGASQSIALTNVVLNTALADVFSGFSDRLERAADRDAEICALISEVMQKHGRIIYNGNNYSEAWVQEARRRGLPIIPSTVEAFDCLVAPKNIALFARHGVFTEAECISRHEILLENYVKVVGIEAATLIEMVRRQVYPAVVRYTGEIAETVNRMRTAGAAAVSTVRLLDTLTALVDQIDSELGALRDAYARSQSIEDVHAHAEFMRSDIRLCMESLRAACDAAETIMDGTCWPMPTYTDLLLRV